MKDLYNKIKVLRALSPSNTTDDTPLVSEIIDRRGYNSLLFAIALGSLADANATFAVTMDEGDEANLSDASAVAAGDLLGSYSGAGFQYDDDNEVRKIGYRGAKRYVRLTITPTGNTGNAYISAMALLSDASQLPVS